MADSEIESDDGANRIARSAEKLDPDLLYRLISLTHQQPWLERRQKELLGTLDICETSSQQDILSSLLFRFKYISHESWENCISQIKDRIIHHWNCQSHCTKIASTSESKYSDSSDAVLYSLKAKMAHEDNWETINFVTRLSECIVPDTENTNIVLVDEFCGSGQTILKKIKWIKVLLQEKNSSAHIFVCFLATMAEAEQKVIATCDGFFSCNILQKGLSDYYEGENLEFARRMMRNIEEKLATEFNNQKLYKYSFGYKKSEALYYREGGNTVNNVFPVFWWRKLKESRKWQPLLRRI